MLSKEESKGKKVIRLNKCIANSGLCSRREADKYIQKGLIKVNGVVIKELGTKVGVEDKVTFKERVLTNERKVYVLLNKPKDFVTTTYDPKHNKTVMDLVKSACSERIYPVGRLDRSTLGLLLFTNDGEVAKKLTHPKYEKKKVYYVFLDKPLHFEDFKKIKEGVNLEDGHIKVDEISYIEEMDKTQVGIEIHSGRNRIVRRIFEYLQYKVKKLDRVYYAGLTKKNLSRGKWRFLTSKEVHNLKLGLYK